MTKIRLSVKLLLLSCLLHHSPLSLADSPALHCYGKINEVLTKLGLPALDAPQKYKFLMKRKIVSFSEIEALAKSFDKETKTTVDRNHIYSLDFSVCPRQDCVERYGQ